MYKKNLKFLVMSKDMAKSLVAAALMVAFSTPVAANTATGSRSASGAFSKQADGIVMRTGADGSNGSNAVGGLVGLEYLVGKTEDQIKNAALKPGSELNDNKPDEVFFLYNVKTGKFLNAGGYWGTHVSLKDYPLSLWAEKHDYKFSTGLLSYNTKTLIDFIQNLETGQDKYLGWVGKDGGTGTDDGVFIDRHQGEKTHCGWVFVPLNDEQHTYKIYTYATKTPSSSDTKYYLCANGDDTDQDKNCGAFSDSYITSKNYEDYRTWRVLSMKQISDLLLENSDNMTSALDLSYRLDCPGFSRGDKDIKKWKVSTFATGTKGGWRFGLEHLHNKENTLKESADATELYDYDVKDLPSKTPYYTFEGSEYKDKDNYERHLGKYFCADAKNMRGVIYQDVVIKAPGSYIIECKGYSTTTKAKIFASWFDNNGTEDKNFVHQNVLNQVSYMSKAEQNTLHVSEQNMDYAGKNFYGKRKYINTVLVQVPKSKKQADGSYGKLRFGLIIGDNQNDKTVNEADNEWTVFDDFRLLYASDERGTDLILDEDRDNLDYLKDCSNTYKNTVLHLNKTFTKDKWNSFVLPVSLNRDQFRQAFGANARLAKLSNLTSSEIQFQTVNMDAITDNSPVLDAYTPYIIFPTKIHTDNTKVSPAYKATLRYRNAPSETQDVVVKANHYDIPNVTFNTNSANENDLSEMNTDTWVLNVTPQVGGTDGSMEAHVTFARTFGQDVTQNVTDEKADDYGVYQFNDHKIIDGRDNLIGCYFFDRGNLYYSSKDRVRGLRGFSCWFKPVNSSTPTNTKLNLYIDGVANGTTGIDEVAFGDEEPTGKAAKGIYNMNGQLVSNGSDTTNLPAGMYIVNGKKCVVK